MILRAYECYLIGSESWSEGPWKDVFTALSAGKARYQAYVRLKESWGVRFQDIRVRSLNRPLRASDLRAEKLLAFQRVAKYRGLPFAEIGMRVECDGDPGVLVGSNDSSNFDVAFTEGRKAGTTNNCHPRWRMRYFDVNGALLFDPEVLV